MTPLYAPSFVYFLNLKKKNLFIYLFIYGCIGSSLLHTGFLQLWQVGATVRCGARASHCGGFFCCGAWALGAWASVVVACRLSSCGSWALECRLSSYGARAQLLHGMWSLPGPGLEPVSPALVGGFLTTAPPGKSLYAPSFSPDFSCFSGTGGQCTGLTQFWSFNIFLLAGYNQSQPACISKNCSDYPHLPKEQKQDTLGF